MGAVLALLADVTEQHRIRIWTTEPSTVARAKEQFELSAADASALLLPLDAADIEQRQHMSLGLRWCPQCLECWYHCVHFQDRRIRLCPWHRARLLDVCPHCARAVDPLGRPWRCDHCGNSLATEPEHWLTGLKVTPSHDGRWPRPAPSDVLAYEELERGVRYRPDEEGESLLLRVHRRGLEYWEMVQVYESAAVLWDTILGEHRDCALQEKYGYQNHHYCLEFACPVAAAGLAVFGQMGITGTLSGRWPSTALHMTAYQTLPPPGTISLEARRALLRELPRAWVADALMQFGEAVRAGRTRAPKG
ncbi:hypothetical protein AVXHC19_26120 [Acidovorax sacchari]